MTKYLSFVSCFAFVLFIIACSKPETTPKAADITAPVTVVDTPAVNTPMLKIATPKDYTAVEEATLGVNENGKGMALGTAIAAVTVADIDGNPYPLAQAWRDKPALVIFYRGGWCPYCSMQVRELAVKYPQLEAAGVQPVLISVNEPDKAAMMEAQYNIPFPVLSDPQLLAHESFNVVLDIDAETLVKYKEYGIDLSAWSGQAHNKIAVSSAFLVDKTGKVLFSHAPADYSTRPSVEQLVAVIEKNLPAK